MFNDDPEAKWTREFRELGSSRVRDAITVSGWDRDKRQAARRWLERQDVNAWQQKRTPADRERLTLKQRLRQNKLWIYIFGAIAIGMLASRIFRVF